MGLVSKFETGFWLLRVQRNGRALTIKCTLEERLNFDEDAAVS